MATYREQFGPPAGRGLPKTVLPDSLVQRTPEQTVANTADVLQRMGYSQKTIDSLTIAKGTPPVAIDVSKIFTSVLPLPEEAAAIGEETWKVVKQLHDEGINPDGQQIEQIARNIAKYAGTSTKGGLTRSIRGIAETRQWWSKFSESVADRVTQTATGAIVDLTPGLATLDIATYIMKQFKLKGFAALGIGKPGQQFKIGGKTIIEWPGIRDDRIRAEAELRMLPKIMLTTQDGREQQFATSMAAGWYLTTQKARSALKYMAGTALQGLGGPAVPAGAVLQQQAQTTSAYVRTQSPPLAAAMGEYPLWLDIEEANMTPEDLQWRYKWIYDHGTMGNLAALTMSLGTATVDMIDPTMVAAAIPGGLMKAGRGVIALARPLEGAQILSGIASKTERAEDAMMALRASTKYLGNIEKQVIEEGMRTGEFGRPSLDNAKRLVIAKRLHATDAARMADLESPGEHEHILIWRTAKRDATSVAVDQGRSPIVAGTLTGEVEKSASRLAYEDALKRYTELLGEHGGVVDESLALAQGELHAGNTVTRTTGTHRLELYKHPSKPAYIVSIRGATPNTLKNESVEVFRTARYRKQAERLVGMRGAGMDPALRNLPDAAAWDMEHARLDRLTKDYDAALSWDGSNYHALETRRIMGPDGAEEAGDVLNQMAHTGGLGMDDVAVHPVFPEYNSSSPATGLSHINLRQLRATENLTRTEREAVRAGALDLTEGERLGMIPMQVLYKKRDLLRRTYGAARTAKDEKAIALYRKKLAQNGRAIQRLRKNTKQGFESFAEEGWLPDVKPGITQSPERYNNWIQIASDRVKRSLYPSGLRLNNYWMTRVGMIHNQGREPMRFFRNYSPRTWDVLHGSFLEYQKGIDSWNERMYRILEEAKVLEPVSNWNPKKAWAPFNINTKRAELLFDMLDTPETEPGFAFAMEMAHDDFMTKGDDALRTAHGKIRQELNHAADMQGVIAGGEGNPRYLTGYIRHVITGDQFADGAVPLEYIGLPANASAFVSHLKERTGSATYSRDLFAALDLYGRGMNRKLHLEPMYQELNAVGRELAKTHNNSALQSYTTDLINELKGRPHFFGAKIDNIVGGGIGKWAPGTLDRTLMGVTSAAYTAMIVGNPRYALMQMATGANTTISKFGAFRTMRGILQFATPEGRAINEAMGTYKPFRDIFEDPKIKRVSQFLTDKGLVLTPLGPMSNGKAEEVIRGITAFTAIDQYLTKFGFATWDEAKEAGMAPLIAMRALQSSQECNHLYGPLGRSPAMSRLFGRANVAWATQFLSFTWKQTDELLAQFADDPSRIFTYLATAGFFSRVAAQNGINLTDYIGLGYLPNKTNDLTSPGVDAFVSMVDLSAALDSHDPGEIQKASSAMVQTVTSYIPLMNAMQSAAKATERLAKGQLLSASGEYIRPMDFAQTLTKQEGQHWYTMVARSIKPEEGATLGGELIPTVYSQRNIREELTRRANQAIQRENKIYAHNLQRFVEKYADAIVAGNMDEANKLAQTLTDTYKIRFKSAKPVEREIEARFLSRQLRMISPEWGGDPDLFDRYIEILRNYGINVEEIK
jgi:hypothetical protein